MLQILLLEKKNYFILLFWMALGIFTGPLVYAAVPVHMLIMRRKHQWIWLILGFWLILTLSDSRQGVFHFAQNLKTVIILALSYVYLTSEKEEGWHRFIQPFIPFLVVAFISLLENPRLLYSFQKTFSYLLLLLVIPGTIRLIIKYERDRFLYNLILVGTLVLTIGLALRFIYPSFVIFQGERFSGLLGNPNGLGIYSFIFLTLFTYIHTFHKQLFTHRQAIFIYVVITLSLIMAGSRGGIFSAFLFVAGWFLMRRNVVVGFAAMIVVFASYQLVMANFVEIVLYLNLQDFFRLSTLDTGSGRLLVAEVAWKHINMNYWFSKGFTYSEYILAQYADYFVAKGHQGNVHNSWLTMWMDTGLVGLILFSGGWLVNFFRASRLTPMVWALLFGLLLSISVESWLVASLNPFTIVLVIILTLLADENFYRDEIAN